MNDRVSGKEFTYVRDRLYGVFLRMDGMPFTGLNEESAMRRTLSDMQWMLNHHHYPTPGQVDFLICLLRDEKFRRVRERGAQAIQVTQIQRVIDELKDIRKFLEFITRYESDGDIITLRSDEKWKDTALLLCVVTIVVFLIAQVFIFSGQSSQVVFLCEAALFFLSSLFLEGKAQVFSFSGLLVFSLLFLCVYR
ncbi:TPA: hypothetical protein ACOEF8_004095 [Enterobacter roggenkampii]